MTNLVADGRRPKYSANDERESKKGKSHKGDQKSLKGKNSVRKNGLLVSKKRPIRSIKEEICYL